MKNDAEIVIVKINRSCIVFLNAKFVLFKALFKKTYFFLIFLITMLPNPHALLANQLQPSVPYLLKPAGEYGVGYQDIFLINTNLCPDAFYQKGTNENDFSSSNKKYCHEIVLRVYYPSEKPLNLYDSYDAPSILPQFKFCF